MAHARRVIRCHGCGAILQSDNKKLPGFISKSVVENGAYRGQIQLNLQNETV